LKSKQHEYATPMSVSFPMVVKKLSGLVSASVIAASSLMFPSLTPRVLACDCADVSPDLKFRHADAVFMGKAISRKDLKAGAKLRSIDPIAWTFDVERVFKGNVAKQQSVLSAAMGASCGIQFKVGDRYQVYAKRQGSTLSTHLCSGTKPLAVDIHDLLRDPPLRRTRVEIDGYYSGQTTRPMRGEVGLSHWV
jgi:Tissue inhibitor of metalloproteinase